MVIVYAPMVLLEFLNYMFKCPLMVTWIAMCVMTSKV